MEIFGASRELRHQSTGLFDVTSRTSSSTINVDGFKIMIRRIRRAWDSCSLLPVGLPAGGVMLPTAYTNDWFSSNAVSLTPALADSTTRRLDTTPNESPKGRDFAAS